MDFIANITNLIDKTLFIIFFMSCLVIIRTLFLFIRHLSNPEPRPFVIESRNLFYLGLSVSIILMTIFKGIGL
jgi:hypothetical protein